MKLLIVDDQRATLKGLADNIPWQEDGFDVVDTAATAMEARLSFGRGRPEVMLCDIEMPVENGIEFCRLDDIITGTQLNGLPGVLKVRVAC